MTSYQVVVLSGGGARGAYGLGVLLALDKFHKEREKKITTIYCGASVGALNATLAAQGELRTLKELYARLRTKDVLGTSSSEVSKWGMFLALRRSPFYYFNNSALRSTIERYVRFDGLYNSHLLICATNYITGELETFYTSRLIDDFLAEDQKQPPELRRMVNYHRIDSQGKLVGALLASSAIPFYLPPVKLGAFLYVDGGVGNNTPLRQAAYICRFLVRSEDAQLEPTFCVINDPIRFRIEEDQSRDIFGVVRRTMDIFHNELLTGSHFAWERINKEVRTARDRESLLESDIGRLDALTPTDKAALRQRVGEVLRPASTLTPRCELPLLIVRPKTPLVEDVLSFDPDQSRILKLHGIADCLELLEHKNLITHNNHRRWSLEIE
jgi:hypothetical protein